LLQIKAKNLKSIELKLFYKEGNDNQVIRFCFVKQNKTLEKAVEQLKKFKA